MANGLNKICDSAYLENQLSLARNEINNLRQQLRTLNQVHRKECDEIYQKLRKFKCYNCGQHDPNSDRYQPLPCSSTKSDATIMKYIGIIHTQFPSKRGTPRQSTVCSDAIGKLVLNNEVFTNPQHALEGLEHFSHMWIIFHFHQTESKHIPAKVAPPRLNGIRMGVFGTRSPHRPSPLGLSLVKINRIVENVIYFSGVDMVDQTPVWDIKPFIPQYDSPSHILNTLQHESGPNQSIEDEQIRPPSGDGQTMDNEIPQIQDIAINDNPGRDIRTLEGQENELRSVVPGATDNETSRYFRFEAIRPNSRMGEREAPDGEEEGPIDPANRNRLATSQSVNIADAVTVSVPRWVETPVVPTLTVHFKMSAEIQLRQLGVEGEEKKRIIKNVLSEDPRSVYLRERQGDSPYVFRIADLNVSCGFNDDEQTVYVFQVIKSDGVEHSEVASS